MAVRERLLSRVEQPQDIARPNHALAFNRDAVVVVGDTLASVGSRPATVSIAGSQARRAGTDGPEWYHPTNTGADYTSIGSHSLNSNCCAILVRFRLDSIATGNATLFNSRNDAATSGAIQIRSNAATLQVVVRDTAVRLTGSKTLAANTWYTAVVRIGRWPVESTGSTSVRLWIDGEDCGSYTNASSTAWGVGEFAFASGRYATDTSGTPQARACSVSLAAVSFSSASDEELRDLSAQPELLFEPESIFVPVSAGGGGSAALEAAAAIALTASGSLTTAIELAAGATGAGQAAGVLATSIPLAGVSVSATLAGGELTTQIRLAGDALAAVSASGDLTTAIRLSADSVAAALATGALAAGSSGLAGDATAGVAAAGDLTTSIPLAGGATVSVIAAGELATTISLAGAAVGVVSATGDLVVALQLSADAVAAALAGATLTTSIAMSGAAVAAAVAAGSLTAPSTLQQIGNRGIGAETPLIPGVRLGDTHADFSAPRLGGASPGISGRRIGVTAPRPFRRI